MKKLNEMVTAPDKSREETKLMNWLIQYQTKFNCINEKVYKSTGEKYHFTYDIQKIGDYLKLNVVYAANGLIQLGLIRMFKTYNSTAWFINPTPNEKIKHDNIYNKQNSMETEQLETEKLETSITTEQLESKILELSQLNGLMKKYDMPKQLIEFQKAKYDIYYQLGTTKDDYIAKLFIYKQNNPKNSYAGECYIREYMRIKN